jgi:chromosome segregation protein
LNRHSTERKLGAEVFLKTLEIFGFKSFADRVRIEFSDGVAALLGPNGCGKSNVVDAVKWVLGEQSSKSLRAERMEDIIFAGSESRKPIAVAEVALELSNEKEILPLDLPEISIRRRLYRSGESEYFINNNPVKLRDVRELFFDTGIGKSAYSIMEQGRIDQLLSTKPEDRRIVFEEAAGITRFRVRSQEAERKLERTEENMRHIGGILEEVRRSYQSLKGQAEKAEAYRALKDQIFEAELEMQLLRLKALMDDRRRREARLAEREKGRDALRAAIDGATDAIARQIDSVNAMERALVESSKRLYQLDLEKTARDGALRMERERIAELGRSIEAEEARERALQRKIGETDADAGRRRESLDELARQAAETERNIESFSADIEGFAARMGANEEESRSNESEIHGLEEDSEHLRLELRAITEDIVTQLDQRLRESGYSSAERRRIEGALSETMEHLRIQLAGRAALLEDAAHETVSTADRERVLAGTLAALKAGLERLGALAGLLEEYRRYTPSFLDEFVAPEGIITRKREIDHRLNEILDGIARRRQRNAELRTENLALRERIDEYRKTLEALRINLARLQTQHLSVEQEIARLARERSEQQESLAEVARATGETRVRIAEAEARITAIEEEQRGIARREADERSAIAGIESEIGARNQELAAKERELKERNAELSKAQGEVERLQIEATEIRTEIREMYANFQERYSRDLSEYEVRIPDLAPSADLRPRLAELREQQRKLGSVNLMAPEEFAEVRERFEFLSAQLGDLTKAREDLKKVTVEIRSESTELFLDTYNLIKRNFHAVFRRLFGGGRAELRLDAPDKPLESGIDILAQPPGKKLEHISLLSGGEKSLTGVALMFAMYMVKPSPFCLLDEIDAALDEENVGRLITLLKEFSTNSQFVVITHNKRTVAGADTLYGVTMEESGVSKMVAIRLENRARAETVGSPS